MSVVNSLVRAFTKKRLQQIEFFMAKPEETQLNQFNRLIKSAANTYWGQKYGFKDIKTIESFQNNLPVQKYEDIRLLVDKMRMGEENIFWPGIVKWFAKSSGTTDEKSKFIPVTRDVLQNNHFKGGKDMLFMYQHLVKDNKLFKGKTLTLGGSHQIDHMNDHAKYGDLSAILIQNSPSYVSLIRSPRKDVALIAKWEEKLEKLTRETLKQDIRALAGVPSWNMVMIKHILNITGKNNLLEVWPNLELFIHGGVNFTPYREQYKKLIPSPNMHYLETYNASEGFFAMQNDLNDPAMLLMLDYDLFYEFIPMDDFMAGNFKALHIGQVKTGVNYALVISTSGGLWRYVIGDTVMFHSLYPHKLTITGRTKHFINAFGEEVVIENAEKALEKACNECNAFIAEYTAAPIYMKDNAKGSHEWIIEFDKEPNDLNNFIQILDTTLMTLNSDYEAKRYKNITLEAPTVRVAPKGTFYQWFSNKGKLGGQNKMPRLSNERKYIEELYQILDIK